MSQAFLTLYLAQAQIGAYLLVSVVKEKNHMFTRKSFKKKLNVKKSSFDFISVEKNSKKLPESVQLNAWSAVLCGMISMYDV